ncbi:HNH endonuclease [Arthrobacter sp. RT-1]|uniref:HNH endonuclease signature motif containing protein n=1 Tax=Arthrobacter sp. RT-1 TaxID=2292263 RepID=UPI000E1F1C77|nr:HNH endonuclease signature motif containing protein [Arthrobacter sp. RT-1]RDV11247.1 HNH endonuclease [Arthrobacter sp. RT-1]
MEAIGEQLAEFGSPAAALPRVLRPAGGSRHDGYDGDAPLRLSGRLHAVPAKTAPDIPVPDPPPCLGAGPTASETDRGNAATESKTAPCWVSAGTGTDSSPIAPDPTPAPLVEDRVGLGGIGALLVAAAVAAQDELARADYVSAANFAGQVEDLSRTVEYLQLLAASAVDRTRTQAITAADAARTSQARAGRLGRAGRGWVTGWDANGVETLNETDANWPAAGIDRPVLTSSVVTAPVVTSPVVTSPADDGCRNTAEFLRLRLRIPLREARRRLTLAHQALPGTSLTGEPLPPAREHLTTALTPTNTTTGEPAQTTTDPGLIAGPVLSSHAATIITATLDRLQHHTTADTLDRIEQHLTTTAITADPDFLTRLAQRWNDTIDADGTEPTEEALRHTQGAFIRKPRHGLHRLEIFATTDQYEHLLTVMNTATNPRTATPNTSTTNPDPAPDPDGRANPGREASVDPGREAGVDLERRTRAQQQLDGLVSAVKAALTTNLLPITGGNRPQIIATINYQDLLPHLPNPTNNPWPTTDTATGPRTTPRPGTPTDTGARATSTTTNTSNATGAGSETGAYTSARAGTGAFVFTGPVAAATLRKIACDADIIPALLGTNGEILDLGRKTRLFTPAQRLALTARDQGCTFPNCTIPAPWCEAHHITYWSHGGPTTTTNGALLCTHHHHLIHKEQWTITTTHGTPTFIPPPHIDPTQKPQQNHYFKPPPPPHPRE